MTEYAHGWTFDWKNNSYWIFHTYNIKKDETNASLLYNSMFIKLNSKPFWLTSNTIFNGQGSFSSLAHCSTIACIILRSVIKNITKVRVITAAGSVRDGQERTTGNRWIFIFLYKSGINDSERRRTDESASTSK